MDYVRLQPSFEGEDMSLINWEEAEKYTSWALGKNEPGPGDTWDNGADGWQRRIDFEKEFTKAQVDACTRINKDTTVLDACCGTGRTALSFAKKAKHVYAVDGAPHMLEHCKNNAEQLGIKNITVQQIYNWHTVEPGKEFPIVDVAVSVIGPPQADILGFSRFATEYCYFLSFTGDRYMLMMKELLDGVKEPPNGESVPRKPLAGGAQDMKDPVVSALMGGNRNHSNLDIYFNILYSHGALPEVSYASGAWAHEAESADELYDYLKSVTGETVLPDKEEIFRSNCDKRITRTEIGLYRYAYESQMFVLGWNPKQLIF